jgi:hypothetical protein
LGEYGGLELLFESTIWCARQISTPNYRTAPGFSLILIMSEFPPIQLSFFTSLLGIGGFSG